MCWIYQKYLSESYKNPWKHYIYFVIENTYKDINWNGVHELSKMRYVTNMNIIASGYQRISEEKLAKGKYKKRFKKNWLLSRFRKIRFYEFAFSDLYEL